MTKLLFVCHGNICRSPMAEFRMRSLVQNAGLESEFRIESAATSAEELGNPVYPPVRKLLNAQGIDCSGKTARQLRKSDYTEYDLLIGMDGENLRSMRRFFGGDPEGKLRLLMDYTDLPHAVADPWYTRDFDAAWRDICEGCEGLMRVLKNTLRI